MFKEVTIYDQELELKGHMTKLDEIVKAWVIFAHGSGSSRKSKRNNWVARELNKEGFGTLLFDLLTTEEDEVYLNRFNIPLLSQRLILATSRLMNSEEYHNEKIAYFGASTGAAAALMAASHLNFSCPLYAIVSRGGRPDLAGRTSLSQVDLPTLLIVGSKDKEVIKLNEMANDELLNSKLVLVPGATHLFEEEGALNEVVRLSTDWLNSHLEENLRIQLS